MWMKYTKSFPLQKIAEFGILKRVFLMDIFNLKKLKKSTELVV